MAQHDLRHNLQRFTLTPSAAEQLRSEFALALSACNFSDPTAARDELACGRKEPGVYFWIVRAWGQQYRLYIGQTTSLSYRLSNYLSPFQPNATNDFKLRICHDLVLAACPSAAFDLYFAKLRGVRRASPELRARLRAAEKAALEKYGGALINQRGAPSVAAKDRLRKAYEAFYRDSMLSVLRRPSV